MQLSCFDRLINRCAFALDVRNLGASVPFHQFRTSREDRLEPVEDRGLVQLRAHRAHPTSALAGCATQQPQNAEEFRKAAPGAFLMGSETFEVNRPLSAVAAAWQRRAPECLNASVRTTSQTSTSYQVITTTYKPTVVTVGL